MIVKKREWLSESAHEAILLIGDDLNECAAFSQPCNFDKGDTLSEPLLAISVQGVLRVNGDAVPCMNRQEYSFAHTIIARVVDPNNRVVSAGSIKIELDDPLPSDVVEGDMIQFSCGRIDVIC